MRRARAQYKLALRECRASEDRLRSEALARKLANRDTNGYWKAIRKLSPKSSKITNKLDEVCGEQDIVDMWREKYSKIFNSVDPQNTHSVVLNELDYSEFINVSEVSDLLTKLPKNKAVGDDKLPAEIFIFASHRLRTLLTIFINGCLRHCYIPQIIINTTLIPILKNKLKPATDSDNYRPVAIATAMSKLIELIILSKCEEKLHTVENQFGFKQNHSTDLCIFALKEITNYYNCQGSPVFICFLDIRKAFDRVNFNTLFRKLKCRAVPGYLVKLIAFWYTNQIIRVRWGKTFSEQFKVSSGIKQGGLLSPFLFNVYVDNLSLNLNTSGIGCVAGNGTINHLAYADDMVLIAPSVRALQTLLDICSSYALSHDILYNTEKSFCMIVWPKRFLFKFRPSFYLQGDRLDFVNQYKYLGVILNDKLTDDDEMYKCMRGVYATGNMIVRRFGKCNVDCKLLMFKTFLSNVYACSLWASYNVTSIRKVKVAHNDIFRSLHNVPRYESASTLFVTYNVRNLDSIVRGSYYSLMCRVKSSANTIISNLITSEARLHSRLWHRWSVALGRDMAGDM